MSKIEEIEKIKDLLDSGALTKNQYDLLLNEILGVDSKKETKEQQLLESGAITQEQYNLLVQHRREDLPKEQLLQPIKPTNSNEEFTLVGSTKWVNKGLVTTKFLNGDDIPKITNDSMLSHYIENNLAGYCYYKYDDSNFENYGYLYTWAAIVDDRKLIPKGYILPTTSDLNDLFNILGFKNVPRDSYDFDWGEDGDCFWDEQIDGCIDFFHSPSNPNYKNIFNELDQQQLDEMLSNPVYAYTPGIFFNTDINDYADDYSHLEMDHNKGFIIPREITVSDQLLSYIKLIKL